MDEAEQAMLVERRFGDVILRRGDAGAEMYLVLEGAVVVTDTQTGEEEA